MAARAQPAQRARQARQRAHLAALRRLASVVGDQVVHHLLVPLVRVHAHEQLALLLARGGVVGRGPRRAVARHRGARLRGCGAWRAGCTGAPLLLLLLPGRAHVPALLLRSR